MDWKRVLSGDGSLRRIVSSLEEADVKQVLQLITAHLSTKVDESAQLRTLWRFQRRQNDHERYGSDLLQERIVADLSRNHPWWKKHGISSTTAWHQWCNRVYDGLGDLAIDRHLKKLWPKELKGPLPFYARLALVKQVIAFAEYYTTLDDEKELLKCLERQDARALANSLAELASLER